MGPIAGTGANYSLLWVTAGTRANHAAVGRERFLPTGGGGGGKSWACPQTFRILLVDSRFLGEGFSSPYSSSGMKMSLKQLGRNGFLPIHRLT